MGFSVPINRWLRGPLREWAEELLSPNNLAQHGFFAVEPIRRRWEEHVAEVRNWDTSLWPVLIFQDWLASGKGRNQSETPQPQLQQHRANSIP
jgi:asparagine synthase (glutamine-hydrolysing)